jgi:two-component system, cell cycle sensor histidine kinase and response regulator CckA
MRSSPSSSFAARRLNFRAEANDDLSVDRYEQRYRQLVERLPVVVYRSSVLSGDWHYVSPALEGVLGWRPEEWLAHDGPWGASVHPDDREAALAHEESALATGTLSSEYRMIRRDGGVVWIHDDAVLLDEDGEPQWHGTLTDVTDQRALEGRLRQSQKLEAVGQLAGGIAHDFNNLLVAISGYGELAQARAGADTELRHELEGIAVAVARARDLTQRLLSFTRKEARSREIVDLNAALAAAHAMLRRLIGADVELVTVLAEEPCRVAVDASELDGALINLAVNARDAMPHGGRLSISTAIAAHGGAAHALLRVADTGTGIPSEHLPRLFEPFFTTKDAGHGTGLGLASVRDFVEGCGGSVEVDSRPGHGTAFSLFLPLASRPVAAAPPSAPAATARSGREQVLVIEDDDAVRDVASRILARAGYTVVEARYGSEALALAEGRRVDLVLSDVVMPGLSGPEVVSRLRAAQPTLPALFMSGYAPESEGSLDGAELVRKPFTAETLLGAVGRTLDAAADATLVA